MHWRLAYTTACTVDHGLYGSTSCSYSLNYTVQKVAVTTLIPNLVGRGCWATGAPQKRCGPRTPYHVLRTLNRVTLQLQKRNKTANINVKNCGLYTS